MKLNTLIAAGSLLLAGVTNAAPLLSKRHAGPIGDLSKNAQDLFDASLEFQDGFWDEEAGYLVTADADLVGRYDSRQTAWYSVGLVARNDKGDIERAERIFANIYKGMYKDPTKIWYGIIQQAPDEPTPQEGVYDPSPYGSYDSNWRDFVGSAFVILLADYKERLSETGVDLVEKILWLSAKGDQYRVGGVDGDNLYPCYSNPWLMRVILQSYAGYYFNDANMTTWSETWAKEAYDLYKMYDTFSEFNSPTYTGVAMWALGQWIKYAPASSPLPGYAKEMFADLMVLTKSLYNANLKNFAGPWDRSYGFDMNLYFSITAATVWGLVGREYAPMPKQISGMYHQADFGIAHLIALGIPQIEDLVPEATLEAFKKYPGPTSLAVQAFSPPFDTYPRNISVWSNDLITIGAEQISELKIGGPATSNYAFNPAVIQWYVREGRSGYITLWAQESVISATAGEGYLDITYPNVTTSPGYDIGFSFSVSPFDIFPNDNLTTMTSLPGLKLEISGNVNTSSEIFEYNIDHDVHGFWSFNSTWLMPSDFEGVPHIHIDVTEYPTSKNVTYSLSDL
ncbi:unnamed protein product [Kuraishia capsulata CBS 1993]|uniref:Uncharacterized protein n=1 Tax=Kuraishia capsulata CBS 1993 TaxID=1382522 RepID=W6MGK0_9ASCO|nr:uncharacterized protein KUCA_T00001221001 [Kuraishia capsulata CBS 1993]CDK25254.1 unnamed protein product [Kuraishia capsulata CBS 1993]